VAIDLRWHKKVSDVTVYWTPWPVWWSDAFRHYSC